MRPLEGDVVFFLAALANGKVLVACVLHNTSLLARLTTDESDNIAQEYPPMVSDFSFVGYYPFSAVGVWILSINLLGKDGVLKRYPQYDWVEYSELKLNASELGNVSLAIWMQRHI